MSKIKDMNFDIKIQNHFWFWGLYFLLNFLRWGAYFNDYEYSFKSNLIEFALHIISVLQSIRIGSKISFKIKILTIYVSTLN